MSTLREATASLWSSGHVGPIDLTRRARLLAALLAVGITASLMVAQVPVGPVVMLVLLVPLLTWAIKSLTVPGERRPIAHLAALVFGTHVIGSALLFGISYFSGHGGFYFGDDGAYAAAGDNVYQYIRGTGDPEMGPPTWGGLAYLLGPYGWIVAAVFIVLGPEILSVEFLNAAFMTLATVLLYELVARTFDRRAALVAAIVGALFPSLQLWTMMNLKDALSLFLVMAALAALHRFQTRPGRMALLITLVVLVPLISLRLWLFYILAICVVAGILVAPLRSLFPRLGYAALAAVVMFGVLELQASNAIRNSFNFESLAVVRRAMAAQARSGYGGATPLPILVQEGTTIVVVTTSPPPLVPTPSASIPVGPTSSATNTPAPASALTQPPVGSPPASPVTPVPTTVVVSPGAKLVLAPTPGPDQTGPSPSPPPGAVYVHPGDRVIVQGGGATTVPGQSEQRVVVSSEDDAVTISTSQLLSLSVLAHAPLGMVYALFAPFPWSISSILGVGVSVDMLLWYVLLAAMMRSLWTQRARWRVLSPVLLYVLGVLAVFALVEGNLGTLFRHRAMIMLPTIALGAPTLRSWIGWVGRHLPVRIRAVADAAAAQLN